MSKNTPEAVTVRAWAVEQNLIPAGQRGRLGTAAIDAWNAANPKNKYPVTYRPAAEAKIKHTVTVEKNGRKVPVTRALPKSEVRRLAQEAGLAGARGILTKAAKDHAFTVVASKPKP
jgi:hypothetical protein